MNYNAFVSVIIPVYNCERYLGQAINSVLSQTYKNFEVIVVDDGSTDNSAEVARSFGDLIRYEFQQNSSSAGARNRGIQLAKGDYLTFLDADDLWTENKLNLQVKALEQNPQIELIFGKVQQFHSPELSEEIKNKIYCPQELMPGYSLGAMMVTRDAFWRVGLFEDERQLGDFLDWYFKANDLGLKHIMLPELLLKRRIHDSNLGIRQRDSRIDYVRVIKASLDRRRAKG